MFYFFTDISDLTSLSPLFFCLTFFHLLFFGASCLKQHVFLNKTQFFFLKTPEIAKKEIWIFFWVWKTVSVILEENVFCSETWSIFSKEQDKLKGVQRKRWKKTVKKATEWNTKVLEKKRHGVLEKKLFNKKRKERTNEESRHKESEHQEGT